MAVMTLRPIAKGGYIFQVRCRMAFPERTTDGQTLLGTFCSMAMTLEFWMKEAAWMKLRTSSVLSLDPRLLEGRSEFSYGQILSTA